MPIRIFIVLILAFLSSSTVFSQNIFANKTNQKIWEAKDRSDIVFTLSILKKGSKEQKILALKGLLSWNDTGFRKSLLKLSRKGNANVRNAALEAIGQGRDSFYIDHLLKIIHKKGGKKIKAAALVALGKCITKSRVKDLIETNFSGQAGYAECLYRAMLKGVADTVLTSRMVKLLVSDNVTDQFYAAWYLARTPHPMTSQHIRNLKWVSPFDKVFTTPDIEIAYIIALGKAKLDKSDSIKVRKYFLDVLADAEKGVTNNGGLKEISVYRAMSFSKINSKNGYYASGGSVSNGGKDKNLPPVQLALSELLSKNCKTLVHYPEFTYPPAIVALIKTVECNNGKMKIPPGGGIYEKIWNMQIMENYYNFYPVIKNILSQTESPAVKSAAMEALIKCRNSEGFPKNLIDDFNQTVAVVIKDADPGAVSIICTAFLEDQLEIENNYEQLLIEAAKTLTLPRDMETYIDIEKVKAKIHKTTFTKPEPEWNNPIDWAHVAKIPSNQKIKVTTNKGEFIIQMNVNEAPGSVSSILKLVESGYYDGKFFHRMVPNFVIQGGCPRGDGFGSQNYTLRSEFSSLKYTTGAVGLASAGPNTESCQWFATHCPTPHLDGRYTIIGYVVSGMETIHMLGVGDKMIKVERL